MDIKKGHVREHLELSSLKLSREIKSQLINLTTEYKHKSKIH